MVLGVATNPDQQERILILGAGPAGLSAAWFLRRRGYRNVTLFEKQSRVGGFCRSVVDHGSSVDIGATYISPEFREVVSLARAKRIKLVRDRGVRGFRFDPETGAASVCGLLGYVAQEGTNVRTFKLLTNIAKYIHLRGRVERQLRAVSDGMPLPETLDCDLVTWLNRHKLSFLTRVFEGPITSFGYGSLSEMPAYYGLRYMTPRAFLAAILSLVPLSHWLPGWLGLRRVQKGYQHLWDELASDFDVKLQVQVESIRRETDGVMVQWSHPAHAIIDSDARTQATSQFDRLIVACPLQEFELAAKMDLDTREAQAVLEPIHTIHYAMVGLEVDELVVPAPLLVGVPAAEFGRPMIVAKPNPQGALVSISTRLPGRRSLEQELEEFRRMSVACVRSLGGRISHAESSSFAEVIEYFHHYDNSQLRSGVLKAWRDLQGYRGTYYTGGLFDFDHVEGAVRASKQLIESHFS